MGTFLSAFENTELETHHYYTRVRDKIAAIPINEVLAHIIQGLRIWRMNGT